MTLEFNPYDPALHEDPYPVYRRLRDEFPVHHDARLRFWTLSRYEDVFEGLQANDVFISEAECFDVLRDPNPHLAFGFGAHFCLGANLARLEARVAFEELLARLRDYAMTRSRVERIRSGPVRGALSLPLAAA